MKSFAAFALFAAASQAVMIQWEPEEMNSMDMGWRHEDWSGSWDEDRMADIR